MSKQHFRDADIQFTNGRMTIPGRPEQYRSADAQQFALFAGLRSMNAATQLSLEAIFSRIERLDQKIDRIEKKLGSVR